MEIYSVSYLVEEINYFLRAKSLAKSGDEKDIYIDKNDIDSTNTDSTQALLYLDILKDDKNIFFRKKKVK